MQYSESVSALESRARRAAVRIGLKAHKSRWRRDSIDNRGGFMLTDRRGEQKYALVTEDDLAKHVGHWMEVKGKAADRGDGKVKIESTTGTSGGEKTKVKTELKGDSAAMNYLGVKSVKMLSEDCR